MNIVRLGHYHTPTGPEDTGFCQWASVLFVPVDGDNPKVNLKVISHEGVGSYHGMVEVSAPAADHATFHLAGDCPWGK